MVSLRDDFIPLRRDGSALPKSRSLRLDELLRCAPAFTLHIRSPGCQASLRLTGLGNGQSAIRVLSGASLKFLRAMEKEQEQAEADFKGQEGREELEEVQVAGGAKSIGEQAGTAREKFEHGFFTSTHRSRGAGQAHAPAGITSPRA